MKKQLREDSAPYPTLFFWTQEYLKSKVFSLGIKKDTQLKRDAAAKRISSSKDLAELDELTKDIRRSGMPNLGTYSIPLFAFLRYLQQDKKIKSFKEINAKYINTYFELNPGGLSQKTQEGHFIQVSSLFKYIKNNTINPKTNSPYLFNLGQAKGGKKINPFSDAISEPSFLAPKELIRFFKKMRTYKFRSGSAAKVILMMKLACFGRLKADDIVRIEHPDISFITTREDGVLDDERYMLIRLKGKDRNERVVYIKASLIESDYRDYIKNAKNCVDGLLFCSVGEAKYSQRTIYDQASRLMKHADISKGTYGLNILRRSYVSYLAIMGVDLAMIFKLLGGSDEDLVDLYVFVVKNNLRAPVDSLDGL